VDIFCFFEYPIGMIAIGLIYEGKLRIVDTFFSSNAPTQQASNPVSTANSSMHSTAADAS
jgi:hypothetical protein